MRKYGNKGPATSSSASSSKDFANYADKTKKTLILEGKLILDLFLFFLDGFLKMGKELGIDIFTDLFMVYFLFKCNAKRNDCLTEAEFATGLRAFGVSSFKSIKAKNYKDEYTYKGTFKQPLRDFFGYMFTINADAKTKLIDFDITKAYFPMFFKKNEKLVEEILKFMEVDKKEYKLKKDEWLSFFDFICQLGNTFPNGYDLATAWTLLLDEYYIKYAKAHNIPLPEGYGEEED